MKDRNQSCHYFLKLFGRYRNVTAVEQGMMLYPKKASGVWQNLPVEIVEMCSSEKAFEFYYIETGNVVHYRALKASLFYGFQAIIHVNK